MSCFPENVSSLDSGMVCSPLEPALLRCKASSLAECTIEFTRFAFDKTKVIKNIPIMEIFYIRMIRRSMEPRENPITVNINNGLDISVTGLQLLTY